MTEDLIVTREGKALRIRLNRPKAIHALNTGMCEGLLEALATAERDSAIEAIVIDHSEGRGFCAGGDIRVMAESGAGDGAVARDFFYKEYRMNHRLFTYAKPTVVFMDGITMGGGVGVAAPCKYRVATENTRFAMPETGIGLIPDVGGGWYLSRLPGRIGHFLALTGHRLDGADCLALGLATHYVPSDQLAHLKECIAENPQETNAIINHFATPTSRAKTLDSRSDIDRLFASDSVEGVFAALEADGGEWATEQLKVLRHKSPQALKVSLRLVIEGATMPTFEDEMRQEYAIASKVVQRLDFIEGVRALIIDKDNAPKWNPATVDAVSDHMIDQIFAPLPDSEAWTPA